MKDLVAEGESWDSFCSVLLDPLMLDDNSHRIERRRNERGQKDKAGMLNLFRALKHNIAVFPVPVSQSFSFALFRDKQNNY